MPRVLRIINRLNLGGPTYNVANLTKYLPDEFETLLLAGMKDEDEESSEFIVEQLGLSPLFIKEMYREINPWKDYVSFRKIVEIIREYKPDIVHTHAAKAGTVGRLAAIYCNVPVVVHTFHGHVFHSYFHPLKTLVFLKIERFLAKRSTAIVSLSNLQKVELTTDFKIDHPDKFHVIPLGFDLKRFYENKETKRKKIRNILKIQDDEIAIGIIGRLVPVKNFPLFLEALHIILSKTRKKVRAVIFGDGELKESLHSKASELNIPFDKAGDFTGKTLAFYSWIKEADEAMAAMDIITLSSHNEGTPVTIIEAQAAGKPFVCTDVGGVRDITQDGITGFLCEKGNAKQFAALLLQLIDDDDLRSKMGKAGHDWAVERFSHHRLAANMAQLYYKLLNARKNV